MRRKKQKYSYKIWLVALLIAAILGVNSYFLSFESLSYSITSSSAKTAVSGSWGFTLLFIAFAIVVFVINKRRSR